MAVCLVMQFRGIDRSKYDKIVEQLGLTGANPDWAPGFISHVVGFEGDIAHVVDVWESREDFERFVRDRLQPAFASVGSSPNPSVTVFEVYNTMQPTKR
jgi:hypothetical protein